MRIIVNGLPAPQGSKVRNRYGAIYESNKAVAPWREAIRAEVQRTVRAPLAGPVEVMITFGLPRPRGHYGSGRNAGRVRPGAPLWPVGKPDIDKLARAVLDGLTEGGAWKDDSQVTALSLYKRYADGTQPGCSIDLWDAEGNP